MQRLQGGLVSKAHRLCASLNSRLESNKEEEESHDRIARTHNSSISNVGKPQCPLEARKLRMIKPVLS